MPKGTPIRCSTCRFWQPETPKLDGGRALLGTCSSVPRYEDFARTVRYRTGHNSDPYFAGMAAELAKKPIALIQCPEPDVKVFYRTTAEWSCAGYEGKPAPVEAPVKA